MIIRSVKIKNFRGFEEERTFVFSDRKFILMSASNGKGKTSIIDAIEWCLTGNIGRLSASFNSRSTNSEERKKNVDGLLKNKNIIKGKISVEVLILIEGEEYVITRTQTKDILDLKASNVTVNGAEEGAQELLSQLVDRNFYNHHFCDVQKTFKLLSSKRNELPELFKDFISDYSREEIIAYNLEVFADDVERKIDELLVKKTTESQIELYQEILKKYEDEPSIIPYNKTKLYVGENTTLSEMSYEEMSAQLRLLYKCGYYEAYTSLNKIVENEEIKNILISIKKVVDLRKENKETIDRAVEFGLHKGNEIIRKINEEIETFKGIRLSVSNVRIQADRLTAFNNPKLTIELYNEIVTNIDLIEKDIDKLNSEVSILSKGNNILNTITSLIACKEGVLDYRREQREKGELVNCPLCGSGTFGLINDEEVFAEAEAYKGEHAQLIVEKKKTIDSLQIKCSKLYDQLIHNGNVVLEEKISELNNQLSELEKLKEDTYVFFDEVKKLEKVDASRFQISNLCSNEFVSSEITCLEKNVKNDLEISQIRKLYQEILLLLGFQFDTTENEVAIISRMKGLVEECPEIIMFSKDILAEKINTLKATIVNKEYVSNQKKLSDAIKNNKKIDDEINKLRLLKGKALDRASAIVTAVEKLKRDEYENVGPFLFAFFRKLSRVGSIKNIRVINEGDKVSIIDEKEKNILNVLSNGQLSVFMLSYFLGSAISRSRVDNFKIFFIDDLTACMDDINMLAFIDFMKYQLLQDNGVMEQIFFTTCDDRIRKLIQYKLKGCEIDYIELGEKDFA